MQRLPMILHGLSLRMKWHLQAQHIVLLYAGMPKCCFLDRLDLRYTFPRTH